MNNFVNKIHNFYKMRCFDVKLLLYSYSGLRDKIKCFIDIFHSLMSVLHKFKVLKKFIFWIFSKRETFQTGEGGGCAGHPGPTGGSLDIQRLWGHRCCRGLSSRCHTRRFSSNLTFIINYLMNIHQLYSNFWLAEYTFWQSTLFLKESS